LSHRQIASKDPGYFHQPDIIFKNPFPHDYAHFGASVAIIKDNVILIGAPGFSVESSQRVGRVYAFDIATGRMLWTMTGTKEFQQFGR
jgi:outer membrane protein assembly factor BamB